MRLFTFFADLRGAIRELRRIADAAERMSPPPDNEPVEPIQPTDVTYADDESLAKQELLEEARRMGLIDEDGNAIEHEGDDVQDHSH